jgi:CheY-like chemotaxis protein
MHALPRGTEWVNGDMKANGKARADNRHQGSILVIDDEYVLRATFQHLLESEGYHVSTAQNGREGLQRYTETRPDLVITDMAMPEMDGFETIESLRKLDPDLPIIAMSALIDEHAMERPVEEGTFCCVAKPVDQRTLFDLVRAILTPNPPDFGDFVSVPARV